MKRHLSILVFLFVTVAGNGQSFLDSMRQKFSGSLQLMQEKLYAHTDKVFYFTGETIWFKIYDVDASFHELMDVSRLAYVELISADHKPVVQEKVKLDKGTGVAFIELPSSMVSGNYMLRAYTNWMKNFSADYFFEKRISVVNAYRNTGAKTGDTSKNRVQFFPEGGNLVYGLESKIGFEATAANGKGEDVSGVIIDDKNDTLVRFASLRFGLGQFPLRPQKGKTYKAICLWKDGSSSIQSLPKVYENGYVLRLSDDTKQLNLEVSASGIADNSVLYLLVHSRQQLKQATMASMANGKINFIINKDSLAEGISHITLFNSNRQPVCERLFFKRPVDTIRFQLASDQTTYRTREKISLSLEANNSKNQQVAANASLSVFLLDSLQQMDGEGITSYLYLTSDLKGNIESPNYYLHSKDANISEATDNLMLTHGWSRFRWEDLLSNQVAAFEFLPEHNGHIINAKLVGGDKESKEGITTYLSVPSERPQFASSVSDQNGSVRFEVREFYGAGDIVVQTNHETDSSWRVDVVSPFADKYSSRAQSSLVLPVQKASTLSHQYSITEVSRIYSAAHQPSYIIPAYTDSTAFYGEPDARYFLDDYTRFTTMEEVLREYVGQVQVRKSRDNYHIHSLNTPYKVFFDNNALVLIDGVPIFDMNKLLLLDPLKIKKIEVLARKFYQGQSNYSGIVNLFTYQGDLGGYNMDPNALVVRYDGMQINKEFYSPSYNNAEEKASRLPDFRSTIFWSPDVHIDPANKSSVQFFSSDIPGKYLVLVEGISQNGKCGSGQSVIEIRR